MAVCAMTRPDSLGGHTIRIWSSTQAVISFRSGEAEYYALIKCGSVGFGLISVLSDMSFAMELVLKTDSAAAKGTASRRGLGKARHIQTCFLWLQERVMARELVIQKVRSDDNLADLLTEHLEVAKHTELSRRLGLITLSGAPQTCSLCGRARFRDLRAQCGARKSRRSAKDRVRELIR